MSNTVHMCDEMFKQSLKVGGGVRVVLRAVRARVRQRVCRQQDQQAWEAWSAPRRSPQNEGTTTEASAKVRCYQSPSTTCLHNHDGTIDGERRTTYNLHCYRARRSPEDDCAQVPAKHGSLTPGAKEGVDAVNVCRR